MSGSSLKRLRLGECLEEVTKGVGASWGRYQVLGATREGLAPAKEPVGQNPDRYKLVEPGTIFYNPMRILLGSIAYLDEGKDPGITSPDYVVFKTRPGMLHPLWFYYWLRSDDGAAFIRTLARGAVRERMLFRRLAAAELDAPSFAAQCAFAEEIRHVERARVAAEVQLALLESLRTSIIGAPFRGIVPLTVERDDPASQNGWSWKPLVDLARLESGHTPSRYHPEWWGGDVPWIALPDIRQLDGRIAVETQEYTNDAGIANSAARVLPKGTVVLSRTASVGFVTLMGRPMATSQDFVNWVCGPELEPWFLVYLLIASRRYIRSLASGAVHSTVYMPTVEAFRVCVPRLAEQRRIAAQLGKELSVLNCTTSAVREQREATGALQVALLRQAFSEAL